MKRVIVVTGGGQGIGKGIVRRMLADGAVVYIAELDVKAGLETTEEYRSLGEIYNVPTDTGNEQSVEHLVKTIREQSGSLHGLVNNAGIANPMAAPLETLALSDWERVIRTNLTGYFLCAKYCSPLLRLVSGAIVNVASTRAFQSERNTEPYSASKGGVVALTHAMAISLGPEVRVNCISPGWIETSAWKRSDLRKASTLSPDDHTQHPAGRVGTPDDIAGLTAYLLSDQAGFITGQNFVVDGGMTVKMIYTD